MGLSRLPHVQRMKIQKSYGKREKRIVIEGVRVLGVKQVLLHGEIKEIACEVVHTLVADTEE